MYCKNCGNEINDDSYICPNCGVKLKDDLQEKKTKKSDGRTLGIVGLCFSFLVPMITIICSSIGLANGINKCDKPSKTMNIIALSVAGALYVVELVLMTLGYDDISLYNIF